MGWNPFSGGGGFSIPGIPTTGNPIGDLVIGKYAPGAYQWVKDKINPSDDEGPDPGTPPTAADIDKQEADKARLRRQRAAAMLAGGRKSTILTNPLGTVGGITQPSTKLLGQ